MGRRPRKDNAGPKRALLLAAALREQIVRRELPAGTQLPVETDLIGQLDASRFTVREALRVLEVEGLLEIRRGNGGGPRVAEPSIAFAAQAVGVQLQLRQVSLVDVWQTRTDLVLPAVEALASEPRPDVVAPLEAAVERLAAAELDVVAFPKVWVDLTEQMVRLAGNEARYVLVCALHDITERQLAAATTVADPAAAAQFRTMVVESCRKTVRLVAAGKAAGAVTEFASQSGAKRDAMIRVLGDATVVDVFPWRHPGADLAESSGRQDRGSAPG